MILEALNLEFTYPGGNRKAVQGVNLRVDRGDFLALLGPNGSGKTTLFKLLIGLLAPSTGEIKLKGENLQQLKPIDRYRQIGFVFQDPNDQLFAPTVEQDVSFGPTNLGLKPADIKKRVGESLRLVGMDGFEKQPIHHLSFGQRKRVAIAGVLAVKPEVLILDEPTAGLDPSGVSELMHLLRRLNSDQGLTVLVATHDVDLVPVYAATAAVLKNGTIIVEGRAGEVFRSKKLIRSASLRLPRVSHLFEVAGQDGDLPLTIGQAREALAFGMAGVRAAGSDTGSQRTEVSAVGSDSAEPRPAETGESGGSLPQANRGSKKEMRSGLTTGTCAAAAAKAAALALTGQTVTRVSVTLPGGTEAVVPVDTVLTEGACARAAVIKDGGDDPDVTTGLKIWAAVRAVDSGFVIKGGEGIGTVTKPGLVVAVGMPAVNPVPRKMIESEVRQVIPSGGVEVELTVPGGREVARRTLNGRLGIEGGISIIGTTGIVQPMSEEAWRNSLAPQIDVALAAGHRHLLLTPGKIGQDVATSRFGIPADAVVQTSNFIGFMLEECVRRDVKKVVLFGHIGKLAKVAAGVFHTHNRVADARLEAVAAYAARAGAAAGTVAAILEATTVEGIIDIVRGAGLGSVFPELADRAARRAEAYTFHELEVGAVLVDRAGSILGADIKAGVIGGEAGWPKQFA